MRNFKRAGEGGSLVRVAWIRISLRSFRLKALAIGQDVFSALRESICWYAVIGGVTKISAAFVLITGWKLFYFTGKFSELPCKIKSTLCRMHMTLKRKVSLT